MFSRLRRAAPFVIGLALFVAALEVLRVELRAVTWREISADVWQTPRPRLLLALVLTALNYVALTGYDFLAFAYIGKSLRRLHVAAASFLAYAISNNVGMAMLSGGSIRYRFYTRWGVTAEELSRIVFSYSVTFWLGLFALGGLSLAVAPIPDVAGAPARSLLVGAGMAPHGAAAGLSPPDDDPPDAVAHPAVRTAAPHATDRPRADRALHRRLDAGRRRALRVVAVAGARRSSAFSASSWWRFSSGW